jgi:hypothetical protein
MFFDCKGTKKTGKSQIFFRQHDIFSLFLRTFASENQVDYAKKVADDTICLPFCMDGKGRPRG